MHFEEIYGKWLVGELNTLTVAKMKRKCKYYDEVAFKPLRKDPDEIAVMINGGGAVRSGTWGQDQNSLSLNVVIVCKNTYAKKLRSVIDTFQQTYNAKPMTFSYVDEQDEKIEQNAKSVFFTPITIDEHDYPTDKGTIKAVWLSFNISLAYGRTAAIEPSSFTLYVDGDLYDVKYLVSYDVSVQPSYDTYLTQGDKHPMQNAVSVNNAWALTIAKVHGTDDALQKILYNEVSAQDGGLFGKKLQLKRDVGKEMQIRGYQLVESYVDNAAVYVLTLNY